MAHCLIIDVVMLDRIFQPAQARIFRSLGRFQIKDIGVGGNRPRLFDKFVGHPLQQGLSSFPIGPMQAHSLRIENNAALSSLTGATFQVGAGNIIIAGNAVLSQCQVNTFLSAQQAGGWTGVASVSGPLPPCAR